MAKHTTNQKEKSNPFVWITLFIFIPLIIIVVLVIGILFMADGDVIGWAKKQGSDLPVISNFIKPDEDIQLEDKLLKAEQIIASQAEEMEILENENKQFEEELERLKIENKKYEKAIEDMPINIEDLDELSEYEDAAASFRKMEPNSAASILENVENQRAANILSILSGKVRGEILAEMNPEIAATITELLINE